MIIFFKYKLIYIYMKKTYKRKRMNVKKYTKRTKKKISKKSNKRSNRKYFKKVKGGKPRVPGCQEEWTQMSDVTMFLNSLKRLGVEHVITLYPELTENPRIRGEVDFTNAAVLFKTVVDILEDKNMVLDTSTQDDKKRGEFKGFQLMEWVQPKNKKQQYIIRWKQSGSPHKKRVRTNKDYWYYGSKPSYPYATGEKKFSDFLDRLKYVFYGLTGSSEEYFFVVSHGSWMKELNEKLSYYSGEVLPCEYDKGEEITLEHIDELPESKVYENLQHMYFRISNNNSVKKHFVIVRHCYACHNTRGLVMGAKIKATRLNYGTFSKCVNMDDLTPYIDQIKNIQSSLQKLGVNNCFLKSWQIGCSPIFRALLTCYNFLRAFDQVPDINVCRDQHSDPDLDP